MSLTKRNYEYEDEGDYEPRRTYAPPPISRRSYDEDYYSRDYDPSTSIAPNKASEYHHGGFGISGKRRGGGSMLMSQAVAVQPKKTFWDSLKNIGSKVVGGISSILSSDIGSNLLEKGLTAAGGMGAAYLGLPPTIGGTIGNKLGGFITNAARKRVKNDFEMEDTYNTNDMEEERDMERNRWDKYKN